MKRRVTFISGRARLHVLSNGALGPFATVAKSDVTVQCAAPFGVEHSTAIVTFMEGRMRQRISTAEGGQGRNALSDIDTYDILHRNRRYE